MSVVNVVKKAHTASSCRSIKSETVFHVIIPEERYFTFLKIACGSFLTTAYAKKEGDISVF